MLDQLHPFIPNATHWAEINKPFRLELHNLQYGRPYSTHLPSPKKSPVWLYELYELYFSTPLEDQKKIVRQDYTITQLNSYTKYNHPYGRPLGTHHPSHITHLTSPKKSSVRHLSTHPPIHLSTFINFTNSLKINPSTWS